MSSVVTDKKRFISYIAALLPGRVRQFILKMKYSIVAGIKHQARKWRSRLCGLDKYETKTFSQEGEDIILEKIFGAKNDGFYVDIGAHHPRRFSNTHILYRRGWRGINIEPNPDATSCFRQERDRDINLQLGISDKPGKLQYYKISDSALNTFDSNLASKRLENTRYRLLDTIEVPLERLDHVLEKYLAKDTEIDFLSVDAEGLDLSVLRSNNWNIFRPKVVLSEVLGASIADVTEGEINKFMREQGYELFAKTFNTVFFLDKAFRAERIL